MHVLLLQDLFGVIGAHGWPARGCKQQLAAQFLAL